MSAVKQSATTQPAAKSEAASPSVPLATPFAVLGQQLGNATLRRVLQAKLTVSDPRDAYEQEADRVADQVMRMPDTQTVARSPLQIQRACKACEEELRREPLDAEIHRSSESVDAAPTVDAVFESSVSALSGRGRAMQDPVRSFMETRFNADFSGVRVHTDAHAHELARAVNAQAFTVGRNVVFGAGYYAPDTDHGKRLLAHELTHTLQQGAASHVARAPETPPERIPYHYTPIYLASDTPNHLAREGSDLLLKHHVTRSQLGKFTLIVVTDRVSVYPAGVEASLAEFDLTAVPPIRGVFMGAPPGPRYYLSRIDGKPSFGWFGHWGAGEWVTQFSKLSQEELNRHLRGNTPVVIVPGGLNAPAPKKGPNPGGGGTRPAKFVPSPRTARHSKGKQPVDLERASSGDEYTGGDSEASANYPAFPAFIKLSSGLVPVEGANDLTMHLIWEAGEVQFAGAVWNAAAMVDYEWEQWDVTEILQKTDRTELAKARRQTPRDKAAKAEDRYVEHNRQERIEEFHEQVADSERSIATGGPKIEYANLALAPVSALRSAGGHLIDSAWHAAAKPDNQITLKWPKQGQFLVRCIASPREHHGRRYASSVATEFVEVRSAEYIAENTLGAAEAALLKLYIEREASRDPAAIRKLTTQIQNLEATAHGSAVEALDVAVKNTKAELATAAGPRERRRLKAQLEALSKQLQIAERTEIGLPPGPEGEATHALRPEAAIVSQVTGSTFPLWLQLFQVSGGAQPEWVIYDVTSKGNYLGRGHFGKGSSNGEAIEHAFLDFAGANEYGRGTVVMHIPASIPDVARRALVEKNFNRGDERARERLQDLSMVLAAASIVVPGAGQVGLMLGGALAADHIITRWRNGTLELDGALIADLIAVLSGVGTAAGMVSRLVVRKAEKAFAIALDSGNLPAIEKTLAKVSGVQRIAQFIAIANEILTYGGIAVGEHLMLDQLQAISDSEQAGTLTHSAASVARSKIVLSALQNHTFLFAGMLHMPRGLNVEPSPRARAAERTMPSEPMAPRVESIGEYTFASQRWVDGENVHWKISNWARRGGPNRGALDLAPLRFLRTLIWRARSTGGKNLVLTVENITAASVQRTDKPRSTLWAFLGASSVERIDDQTLRIIIPLEGTGPAQSHASSAGDRQRVTGFEDEPTDPFSNHPFADIPTLTGAAPSEPTRTFYRFADVLDPQTMTSRAGRSEEAAEAAGAIALHELPMRADAHARLGLVQHSPFVSIGESVEAMANSPDPWLNTIVTGRPGDPRARRAPFILIFDIPESRIWRVQNRLSQRETECLFLGEDLIDFLVGAMPNPYH